MFRTQLGRGSPWCAGGPGAQPRPLVRPAAATAAIVSWYRGRNGSAAKWVRVLLQANSSHDFSGFQQLFGDCAAAFTRVLYFLDQRATVVLNRLKYNRVIAEGCTQTDTRLKTRRRDATADSKSGLYPHSRRPVLQVQWSSFTWGKSFQGGKARPNR